MRRVALLIGLLAATSWAQTGARLRAWKSEGESMATVLTTWTNGSGDNEWDTNGNWTNSSPTTAANNGNTVYAFVNGDVSNDDINGHDTTGDGGTGTLVQLTFVNYTGDVGTTGDPLIVDIISTNAPVAGDENYNVTAVDCTGTLYLESDTVAGNFTDFVIDSPGGTFSVSGAVRGLFVRSCTQVDTSTAGGGFTGPLYVSAGTVNIDSQYPTTGILIDGGTTNLNVSGSTPKGSDSRIVVRNGVLNANRKIYDDEVVIVVGGQFTYAPTDDPGAFVADYFLFGGITDFSKSRYELKSGYYVRSGTAIIIGEENIANQITVPTDLAIDLRQEFP